MKQSTTYVLIEPIGKFQLSITFTDHSYQVCRSIYPIMSKFLGVYNYNTFYHKTVVSST